MGPKADGTIPELQKERLLGLGQWLDANGEAIFDTRPWVTAEGTTDAGAELRFTQANDALYATLMDTPTSRSICLNGLQMTNNGTILLLNGGVTLDWQQTEQGVEVTLPDELNDAPVHSLKMIPSPTMLTA
ncbi:MAG: alpha-L-fucosidase C-terminal domain-containing protein [Chloroflexota bacterium]